MKKSVLLMAAATAIALSSCSSEETKDVAKSSNITFRSTVGLNSRGAEATTDNLKNIWVSAWAGDDVAFNDVQFAKNAGGQHFNSVGAAYFWEKDKDYTFMAFATGKDNKANLTPTVTKTSITLTDYAPNATLADQLDLLTAQGTGNKANNETTGASLAFDHILSQIQIKVKNTNENVKYTIKGVRISNVKGKGNYTFTPADNQNKHAWGNLSTPSQYVLGQGVDITLDENNKNVTDLLTATNSAMLIPQGITAWDGLAPNQVGATFANVNGSYISLLINVQKKNAKGAWEQVYPKADAPNDESAWTAVAIPAVTWANGNKYIYTLDLSAGAGKVDPVEPGDNWVDGKDPGKGEDILGKQIFFTVDVKPWDDQAVNVPM
jgi:hypothetical protein